MQFTPVNFVSSTTTAPETFPIDSPPWFQTGQRLSDKDYYTLPASESDVRNVRLTIPSKNVKAGSYVLTFDVIDADADQTDNIYAQKDFFIVVRG